MNDRGCGGVMTGGEEEVVFVRGAINLVAQHFVPENLSQ